ncbi:MAG: malate dehydrogenase [Gammaproteobacteria bacterium]|nr:malate dehydrogenase [Gammaproteobacteria bacterium]
MTKKRVKVAITGAAGHICYSLVFRIANGDMFGKDTEVDLHLIELEAALPALRGVVMELEDCAFPLLRNVVCTSDINTGMRDVNWAILVGAVPRKEGMERSDLLKINGAIFTAQGRAINDHAADDVRVLVVGNPCNTNCLIAMNNAPDISKDRFYAMTMLDENRARAQLALKAAVPVTEVKNMNIWGNHSSTQYPDFYNATIDDKPVVDVIKNESWLQKEFIEIIQKRGAEIIKARGSSSAASAANGIIDSVYNLIFDTVGLETYSICVCSQGQYGIDEGLIFSFPCRTENGELVVVTGVEHNAFAQKKLMMTLDELRHERDAVKELGLIEEA